MGIGVGIGACGCCSAPSSPVGLCGCGFGTTLHVTITNFSNCPMLNGNTYAMTYGTAWNLYGVAGVVPGWEVIFPASYGVGGVHDSELIFYCYGQPAGTWKATWQPVPYTFGGSGNGTATSPCTPLNAAIKIAAFAGGVGTCDPGFAGGDLAGGKCTCTFTL